MDTTFDVRVWQIERGSGKLRESYGVRWSVAGKRHRKTFQTFALADGFRAELVTATHAGEPFNMSSGLPERHEPRASTVGWYDFAVQFADAQWPRVSANHRKNTARTLMIVTTALMDRDPPGVPSRRVRTALSDWAFNTNRRDEAPDDVAAVLGWVRRHTPTMDAWTDPLIVQDVLLVLGTLLDGRRAAASSVKRHRRVLHLLMRYAIVRGILPSDPVPESRSLTQRSAGAIDRRRLLNERLAAQLLDWIRDRPRSGQRLQAFFATLYFTGLRPEEAVALRVSDLVLPASGVGQWADIVVHTAEPEIGRTWTDSGTRHDQRRLKARAEGETRIVPCPPTLSTLLRARIQEASLRPGDRLVPGERGGVLAGSVYRRMWDHARRATLPPHVYASPTGQCVYDLRHTRLTMWLNNGIPPAQVAEWAGTSVAMLFATYAQRISGQERDLRQRLDEMPDVSATLIA
ncbi:tyrosine-type recombinase/integrase [Streptomyces sindenensis]|uniref:tyrosine-type recombinase/integrase n=1 Tax=Streptomyces sindenensis TaxID=67363 RepID=UPI001672565E|nr:tyrosine-type recombinase/integrase [Streptomyces sindenensis]GGP84058.1 integrase [Streptomyces sindenensis]